MEASIEVGDRVDECSIGLDGDEMNIGWIDVVTFENDDFGHGFAVMQVDEIVGKSRMSLLTDHLEGEQSEVDLHVLHHDGMDRPVAVVLYVQTNERLWLVTHRATIFRRTLASILVWFGSLETDATVATWLVDALVGVQLASLADVLEWTHAVGPLIAVHHTSIARLTESRGRTVATRTLWVDNGTVHTREATLAQKHML